MSQGGLIGVQDSVLPPDVPTTFVGNTGPGATAALHILNVLGAAGTTVNATGNTLTVTVTGSGMTWTTISASQTLVVDNGYFCVSPGGALILLLPAVSSVGSEIEVSLDGATSFTITQGAGQQIRLGNATSTAGVVGSITSTQQGDSIRMVCSVANLKWNILSAEGNLTIV